MRKGQEKVCQSKFSLMRLYLVVVQTYSCRVLEMNRALLGEYIVQENDGMKEVGREREAGKRRPDWPREDLVDNS